MDTNQLKRIFNAKKSGCKKTKDTTKIASGFITTTFEQFSNWFNKDDFNKGCYYCGTTNEKSMELYNLR